MYTTSSVFLQSLANAGITHAFVNWGSDHPALLEDLERQRTEGHGKTDPEIVTCPNEMVALSAAQGYAQVTGKPAAVIIHVDVGTQALAGAIHNVDRGRTPVLIYAGASPFSSSREHKGGRNEWIMWLQDIPDQSAIVRQYMRYTAQISSALSAPQYVSRALQIARSAPKGPVYLWARREVMEEELPELPKAINAEHWPSIEPSSLSPKAARQIAEALLSSKSPLIITSFLGRNPRAVSALTALSTPFSIPVVATCPSAVNFPASHPYYAGVTFLARDTHSPHLSSADTILVIDSDLPWIPANNAPSPNARVFVLDSGDPLRSTSSVGHWHVDAELVCRADAETALEQLVQVMKELDADGRVLTSQDVIARGKALEAQHNDMVQMLDKAETALPDPQVTGATISVPNILGVLRTVIQRETPSKGRDTLILNESISNYPTVWMHMRPEPGNMLSSGGSSLGWALGAAVGAHIGEGILKVRDGKGHDLIVVIVGDGSFMFGVPSSAYWMARKYNTPFLTIILNNGGWKVSAAPCLEALSPPNLASLQSPKLSMLRVHPDGHGSRATGERLSVGFGPDCPDYAQIAVAASDGWAWGRRVGGSSPDNGVEALERLIREGVDIVVREQRCAVLDCVIESI
ncbi:hypothetical protein H0H92_008411 [Tricholoma furcatifolium]|nr:hypothetical protein H0H92_008411 [Tricholoma furcatifolium]